MMMSYNELRFIARLQKALLLLKSIRLVGSWLFLANYHLLPLVTSWHKFMQAYELQKWNVLKKILMIASGEEDSK